MSNVPVEFLFENWSYELAKQLGKIFWDWLTEGDVTWFFREAKGFKNKYKSNQ